MAGLAGTQGNRQDRRRRRTRDALVLATQQLIAETDLDFGVLAVAERADVALGTLYNHFAGKRELIEAATLAAATEIEAYLSARTAQVADPILRAVFRPRLHGRIATSHPMLAKVLVRTSLEFPNLQDPIRVHAPQITEQLRELAPGIDSEQLRVLLTMTTSTTRHLIAQQLDNPGGGAAAVDQMMELVLRMAGQSPQRAREIAFAPLPPWPMPAGGIAKAQRLSPS